MIYVIAIGLGIATYYLCKRRKTQPISPKEARKIKQFAILHDIAIEEYLKA